MSPRLIWLTWPRYCRNALSVFERFLRALFWVIAPGVKLWPWLLADVVYTLYLVSPQGSSLTTSFSSGSPNWQPLILTLSLSCLLTFSACLITSLVLVGRILSKQPRAAEVRDERAAGGLYIAWGLLLAAEPGLWLAAKTSSERVLAVTLMAAVICTILLGATLRGAWRHRERWIDRLSRLRSIRFLLAGAVLALASFVLAFGAFWVVRAPLSPQDFGPLLVPILGLSTCASLFGALFVALPHCLSRPWLGIAGIVVLLTFNLSRHPLVDPENPLLRAKRADVAAKLRVDSHCTPIPVGTIATFVKRARAVPPPPLLLEETGVPMVFVSAEGGGIRAAYWTALGLADLDLATDGDFGKHVASMSGVSGGSLGIATWLAARETLNLTWRARVDLVATFLSTDFLSSQLSGLFFLDAPRLVFGSLWWSPRRDDVFEAALVQRWNDLGGSDLFLRQLSRLCLKSLPQEPLITFNAVDAVTGAPAFLGNLSAIPRATGNSVLYSDIRSASTRLITVAQAVVNSARFPFLSPGANVGVDVADLRSALGRAQSPAQLLLPSRRASSVPEGYARVGVLIDGGYFDNSGLALTGHFINLIDRFERTERRRAEFEQEAQKPEKHAVTRETTSALVSTRSIAERRAVAPEPDLFKNTRLQVLHFSNDPAWACWPPGEWHQDATPGVRRLISDAKFQPRCRSEIEELDRALTARPFEWLTTPLEGILFVREGRSQQALDDVRHQLSFREPGNSFVSFSLDQSLSDEVCRASAVSHRQLCPGPIVSGEDFFATAKDCITKLPKKIEATRQALAAEISQCPSVPRLSAPPLGWALHNEDAAMMRCWAARLVEPVLLRRSGMNDRECGKKHSSDVITGSR